MNEDSLLKLLEMVASKVRRTQNEEYYGDDDWWDRSIHKAFEEAKNQIETLQNQFGPCSGPYTEELPEDHTEIGWGWRVYGCENHAHIIHLKYGYIVINRELAEKILVLGIP